MLKNVLLLAGCIILFTSSYSQNVGINNSGASPHSSAMLDVQSTNRGFLTPRMTTAQRSAITTPATGLMVYQTDDAKGFYFYDQSNAWYNMTGMVARNRAVHNFNIGTVLQDTLFVFGSDNINSPTGSRLFFYSTTKAAFRAGHNIGSKWSVDVLGLASAAFGDITLASGIGSFAAGIGTTASGDYSVAMGSSNQATGYASVAYGWLNEAIGSASFVAGNTNIGRGSNSTAFGLYNIAQTRSSLVIGQYNDTIPGTVTPTGWDLSHPLIIAGNGVANNQRSNAWVLYKDGSQKISPMYVQPSSTTDLLYNYNGNLYYDGRQLGFNVFSNSNGVVRNSNWITGEDTLFVLGGGSLNNTVLVSDNARLVFHKPTYSFRAGFGNTEDWDYGNIGLGSVGFGYNTRSKGDYSLAGGYLSYADGQHAFAFGENNRANGSNSISVGTNSIAYGLRSVSMGQNTTAVSVGEFVIGRYNDTLASTNPSRTSWFSSNALFVAGNGPNAGNRSNAMVLYKDGTMHLQGAIKAGNVGTELDNVQARTVTLGSCANASGLCTFNVTFETEYFTAPSVIIATPLTQAGISPPDAFSATVKDITTTGFTVIIKRTDMASSWGQQLRLSYLAIQ